MNRSNPALNLAPFGRWTLRGNAAGVRSTMLPHNAAGVPGLGLGPGVRSI